MKPHPVATATLLIGAVLVGACADAPPKGNRAGRVDPYRSTDADQYSREVSSVTLLEFADAVTQQLASRLADVPQIRDAPDKIVIEMGAIENETATPTSDFRAIRRRVFITMVISDVITRLADIVESPELMDEQARRLSPDEMYDAARYDPDDVYVLQGAFGELARGGASQSTYLFDMTLTHLGTRRIVFAEQFASKEVR